jgi:hypothetical protein
MSCDNKRIDFEKLLAKPEVNKIIEALIIDQAFSVEFIASCIAHYYTSILKTRGE